MHNGGWARGADSIVPPHTNVSPNRCVYTTFTLRAHRMPPVAQSYLDQREH